MQLPIREGKYTPEEYLQLEEQTEYKSEYRDGEIISVAGGTTNHNEICLNLAANLKFGLRKQNYRVYIGDVRLWIPRHRVYTYPDVMVIKGEPIYTDKGNTTVTNPILIAEILSKSTQNYDLGEKFTYYRSICEFQEYLLISQEQYQIMQYAKTKEQKWLLSEYDTADSAIGLSAIAFELQLSDIYTGVDLGKSQ